MKEIISIDEDLHLYSSRSVTSKIVISRVLKCNYSLYIYTLKPDWNTCIYKAILTKFLYSDGILCRCLQIHRKCWKRSGSTFYINYCPVFSKVYKENYDNFEGDPSKRPVSIEQSMLIFEIPSNDIPPTILFQEIMLQRGILLNRDWPDGPRSGIHTVLPSKMPLKNYVSTFFTLKI